MSANNGTIKLFRRSMVKFQFGESEPEILLDVIEAYDKWHEINMLLRVLEAPHWRLPNDKVNEHAVNRLNFVQQLVEVAYQTQHQKSAPTLSRFEAEAFVVAVEEEAAKLRNFIYAKTEEPLSTPESTEATNFAQ